MNNQTIDAARRALNAAFRAQADAANAAKQQAYMKSALPYHGLPIPAVRIICREVYAAHDVCANPDVWEATVRSLFTTATHREEWTAAVCLLRHARAKRHLHMGVLPLLRDVIVWSSWWDIVDEVAAHPLGHLVKTGGERASAAMRAWATDPQLWIRRASILCQLRRKTDLDQELLWDCIEPSITDRDFFARKAIGWAMREHARFDPTWVRKTIEQNKSRLSPLSVREASKHLH